MQLLNGREVAAFHRERVERRLADIQEELHIQPELAIILVGDDAPSAMYARSMQKTARAVGLKAEIYQKPDSISEVELLSLIDKLNEQASVFGILPMMPLPRHLNSQRIIDCIDPKKDVDGLTDVNIAHLYTGRPGFVPCTPRAVIAILDYYHISLSGKDVAIIGRSNVVGKPLAQLCLNRNATVTHCHTRTKDLKAVCRRADLVIAAAGRAGLVTGDMIKPGAVVIDVGINRNAEGKVCGDVAPEVMEKAAYMTPVPGGAGPMTITMLMKNTLKAAKLQHNL